MDPVLPSLPEAIDKSYFQNLKAEHKIFHKTLITKIILISEMMYMFVS